MFNQKKGVVYTVTNNNTEEVVYVGVTTKSIEDRKKDHLKKSKSKNIDKKYAFQDAIATYGVDAFKWEQVDTAVTTDELAVKEKEYILKYNTKVKGYNSDRGGGIKKTVYQYNLADGSLIRKHNSSVEAAKSIKSTKQQISRACINKTKYKNFYWSYKFEIPFKPSRDFRKKQVIQMNLSSWKKISSFNSVSEASKITGINKGCIAKCCREERKSAGGYKWMYNSNFS